jgi:threonine dehydrogenase-like Zn-dependent dehydrogenase
MKKDYERVWCVILGRGEAETILEQLNYALSCGHCFHCGEGKYHEETCPTVHAYNKLYNRIREGCKTAFDGYVEWEKKHTFLVKKT